MNFNIRNVITAKKESGNNCIDPRSGSVITEFYIRPAMNNVKKFFAG